MEFPSSAPLLPGFADRRDAVPSGANGAEPVVGDADFQSFLKLLTAQLRNQDPLQPLDSTQFVAQLASFSTVEQLVGVNDRLDAQAELAAADGGATFASWIGRAASATDGRFNAAGPPEAFPVSAIPGTQRVEGIVTTTDGREIERFTVTANAAGQGLWRGADAAGIPTGTPLRIELAYHGADAVIDRHPAAVARVITGLRGTPDGPIFDLADGGKVTPGDIGELRTASGLSE